MKAIIAIYCLTLTIELAEAFDTIERIIIHKDSCNFVRVARGGV